MKLIICSAQFDINVISYTPETQDTFDEPGCAADVDFDILSITPAYGYESVSLDDIPTDDRAMESAVIDQIEYNLTNAAQAAQGEKGK